MPRTEPKKHISLSVTNGELEEVDGFALMVGPGTYRNEAVMAAVRFAAKHWGSLGPVERAPELRPQRPGFFRPESVVRGPEHFAGRVVDDSEDFKQ